MRLDKTSVLDIDGVDTLANILLVYLPYARTVLYLFGPLRGDSSPCVLIIRADNLHDLSLLVPHHAVTRDDVRVLQAHLSPQQESLVPLRRRSLPVHPRVEEVLLVDEHAA